MIGSTYQCVCPDAYSGIHCEFWECDTYICLNNGTVFYNETVGQCECECASLPAENITFVGDHCEYRFPGVCQPNPCGGTNGTGTCVELTPFVYDCACDFGYQVKELKICQSNIFRNINLLFQGENCTETCQTTESGRLDVSIVFDTSGSLAASPGKDSTMYTFMTNLAQMYDTVNQVKVNLVSFSELGILELPMDFYNEIELTDAALNISNNKL